jgi:CBS domain-containing protein
MRKRPTVETLMSTAIISVRSTQSVAEAESLMRDAMIRHLPVIDDGGRLVGVLSNRDLGAVPRRKLRSTQVLEVMARNVYSVRRSTPAAIAAALLIEHKIGSLPVLGDDAQLVGIVTETDFLEVARSSLERGAEPTSADL